MIPDLIQFAALEFDDAKIEAQVDPVARTLDVAFESAFDVANSTYTDGCFKLDGWSRMSVGSDELQEIADAADLAPLEYIFDHWTFGHSMTLEGLNSEPKSVRWQFDAFSGFCVEIKQRSVWESTDSGGHERILSSGIKRPQFNELAGTRVAIETPASRDTSLQVEYARRCLLDAYRRGEFPLVPVILERRAAGATEVEGVLSSATIDKSHKEWATVSKAAVVYTDFGKSPDVDKHILDAAHSERKVRFRRLFHPREAQEYLDSLRTKT
jgi:hypothetical protein